MKKSSSAGWFSYMRTYGIVSLFFIFLSGCAGGCGKSAASALPDDNFLTEKSSNPGCYEFTKAGDYKFVIMDVGTPSGSYINFCLEGGTIGRFETVREIRPEVKNEGRCITALAQNRVSNEYVVRGINVGDQFKAWPSRSADLHKTGLNGTQAEWDGEFRFKVLVVPYKE